MRMFPCLALIAALSSSSVLAGGFGGPGPFRNDSPLPTGVDGIYQASARATNLTGVISFGIANGAQSTRSSENFYTIFNNGTVFRGSTEVNIEGSNISGILDSDDLSIPTNDDGSIDLPVVFIVRGTRAAGDFRGTIQLTSPNGNFSGTGKLTPTPAEEVQIVGIAISESPFDAGQVIVTLQQVTLAGSDGEVAKFRFKGVRKSLRTGAVETATAAGTED